MSDSYPARFLMHQLDEFLDERYGIARSEATEELHIRAFLEYLVERPSLYRNGRLYQRPIRRTLVVRVADMGQLLDTMESPLRLTKITRGYATELQRHYSSGHKGALAAYPGEVAQVIESFDEKQPFQLLLKTATLLIWHTWARPSEILYRMYPEEIDPNYPDGIVITVPRSKSNSGARPENFKILHTSDTSSCAICVLRRWLDWLGPQYSGPLFPALGIKNTVTPVPYSTMKFSQALSSAFVRAGVTHRRYTGYSLRKGQATSAASEVRDLKAVQQTLRHKHLVQSLGYIDRDVLFDLMRRTLE